MNGKRSKELRRAVRAEAAELMASPELLAVAIERTRQDAKWGEQSLPNGTGPEVTPPEMVAEIQAATEHAFKKGIGTWRHILSEEVLEAFAEVDPVKLDEELTQVAAVAVAWKEDLARQRAIEAELA